MRRQNLRTTSTAAVFDMHSVQGWRLTEKDQRRLPGASAKYAGNALIIESKIKKRVAVSSIAWLGDFVEYYIMN